MFNLKRIAFIGGGVMGEAMIKGLLSRELTASDRIVVSDPWQERLDVLRTAYGVDTCADNSAAASAWSGAQARCRDSATERPLIGLPLPA